MGYWINIIIRFFILIIIIIRFFVLILVTVDPKINAGVIANNNKINENVLI